MSKESQLRSFTVIGAFNTNGCPTKVRKNTTYKGKTARGAASKAFTELCRVKNIRGVATLYVVLREKTRGSTMKTYSYFLKRQKLQKPVVRFKGTEKEFSLLYKNIIKSEIVPSFSKCLNHKQSKGRMKKKSAMQRGGKRQQNQDDEVGHCVICLDKTANCVIEPCGHLCLCVECKDDFQASNLNQVCPLCRTAITSISKVSNRIVEQQLDADANSQKENDFWRDLALGKTKSKYLDDGPYEGP